MKVLKIAENNWLRLTKKYLKIFRKKQLSHSFFILFVGLLTLFLVNCTAPPSTPLRIGSNLWTGYETLYLARDLGYYNKYPIKLVDYPSGTEEVRAYRNGEIEGMGLSIDQALFLASTQKNIQIIAIMDISTGGDVILGNPKIKTMKDLKGKRVGVESTSLGAFFIARALEKNGMSPEDISIVSLEIIEHEQAYKQGKVDAVVTFGPPKAKLLEAGANVLFDSSQIPGEIVDTLVVNKKSIDNYPETIQALINGRFKALQYFEKNPQDAGKRMSKRTQLTPQEILQSFEGLKQPNLAENQKLLDGSDPSLINGMKKLQKIMLKNKLLTTEIDPKSILNDRFIKNAHI